MDYGLPNGYWNSKQYVKYLEATSDFRLKKRKEKRKMPVMELDLTPFATAFILACHPGIWYLLITVVKCSNVPLCSMTRIHSAVPSLLQACVNKWDQRVSFRFRRLSSLDAPFSCRSNQWDSHRFSNKKYKKRKDMRVHSLQQPLPRSWGASRSYQASIGPLANLGYGPLDV